MRKTAKCALFAVLAVNLLTGCGNKAPNQEALSGVDEIAMVVSADDIGQLDAYPNLRKADLTGSSCYGEIERYIAAHPSVDVTYQVDLGGRMVAPDSGALELKSGEYTFAELMANVPHLRSLHTVRFEQMELTPEELILLRAAFPELRMEYTVELGDVRCPGDAEQVNLSSLTHEQVEHAAARIGLLPQLKQVELVKENGSCNLKLSDVVRLQKAAPDAVFHYVFELFGKTISTTDREVVFANQFIGDKIAGSEEKLRQALFVMRGCDRFVLDNCHFENEVLASLREECRDHTKLVWRVWFGADGSCLTDREVIRYMPTLTGANSRDLVYCEDARFVDVGHNESLTDCDFVAGMPKLEAIILSGSLVSDLTPFQNCGNLEFLELGYCTYVKDIAPLQHCTNLKRLNLAFTGVSDLSALDALALQVLVDTNAHVPEGEMTRFDESHPDCQVRHTGTQPYGDPWRYREDGTPNDYYANLRVIFDYDHPTQTRS